MSAPLLSVSEKRVVELSVRCLVAPALARSLYEAHDYLRVAEDDLLGAHEESNLARGDIADVYHHGASKLGRQLGQCSSR
jgi:hypothetical protein